MRIKTPQSAACLKTRLSVELIEFLSRYWIFTPQALRRTPMQSVSVACVASTETVLHERCLRRRCDEASGITAL